MLQLNTRDLTIGGGPFSSPLSIRVLDLNHYFGNRGDIIIIGPEPNAEVERVLVTIYDQAREVVEHGQAKWNRNLEIWEYRAKKDFPKDQGARIAVSAVAPAGRPTTEIESVTEKHALSIAWHSGGEVRTVRVERHPERRQRRRKAASQSQTAAQPGTNGTPNPPFPVKPAEA